MLPEATVFSKIFPQHSVFTAALVCALVLASGFMGAQATKIVEEFSGTMVGVSPGMGDTITIDVLHWSADEDARTLLTAFKEKGEKEWADALQTRPLLGYVWTSSESLGYTIRYARRIETPSGGERVILAIGRPLGSWERPSWRAIAPAVAVEYPFSVIELQVNPNGVGEGKVSLAAKVTVDAPAQSIALENYASAPVLLKGLKRVKAAPRARER
jgi:hypothetical protein